MNKLSLLIILLLFINNCSIKKSKDLFSKKTINTKKIENVKTILTKQARKELEFNPNLKIKFSDINFNKSTENNQNDLGNIFY